MRCYRNAGFIPWPTHCNRCGLLTVFEIHRLEVCRRGVVLPPWPMMLLLCLHKPRTTLDSICISRFRCIKLWLGAIISLHSGPPNVRATSPSGLDPRVFSAPSPANSQCFKILRSRALHQMVTASRSIWEQCIHGARLDWRAHSMPCSTRPTTCRHVWSLPAQAAA